MPAKPLDERELIDRISNAMGRAEVGDLTALTGGSSLAFSTTVDDVPVVLKVCPPGLEPVRNRDMLRQARAQKALQGTPVRTAQVLAEDAGEPPDVPPFPTTSTGSARWCATRSPRPAPSSLGTRAGGAPR